MTIFEVEDILDYKDTPDGRRYLIKWAGYNSRYNSWEPEENIQNGGIYNAFINGKNIQKERQFIETVEDNPNFCDMGTILNEIEKQRTAKLTYKSDIEVTQYVGEIIDPDKDRIYQA